MISLHAAVVAAADRVFFFVENLAHGCISTESEKNEILFALTFCIKLPFFVHIQVNCVESIRNE